MNACGARGVWTSAPFLALGRGNRGTSWVGSGPGVPAHKRCPRLASPQKEGEFTLHGRAILEMDQYIRETYPDAVKVCNICRSLLIQGQSCETCGIRMHLPCVAKYFQSSSEPHCPHCNDYWPHEVPGLCPPATRFPPGL